MADSPTVAALRQAADGLTYQSETDAPWEVFNWPTAGEPTADEVRKQGRHPKTAPVVEQIVAEFFTPLTENQDWYGDEEKAIAEKYRSLLAVVRKQLVSPKVFRFGERTVVVYIVGKVKDSGLAGLKTTAVET